MRRLQPCHGISHVTRYLCGHGQNRLGQLKVVPPETLSEVFYKDEREYPGILQDVCDEEVRRQKASVLRECAYPAASIAVALLSLFSLSLWSATHPVPDWAPHLVSLAFLVCCVFGIFLAGSLVSLFTFVQDAQRFWKKAKQVAHSTASYEAFEQRMKAESERYRPIRTNVS